MIWQNMALNDTHDSLLLLAASISSWLLHLSSTLSAIKLENSSERTEVNCRCHFARLLDFLRSYS
jgi:hypothetical protein